MNVQVEHLENHSARMTVRLGTQDTDNEKKKAARRLSKQLRIPGFRPGKAPYSVVVKMIGADAILEEAVDGIGNKIYQKALAKTEIDPVAPGAFEEYEEDNGELVMTYSVPKQPDVDLKDYRELRRELEIPPVADHEVTDELENLRESLAVVEDVQRAAKIGDEVELQLLATFWHEEEHDHEDDEDEDEDDEHDDESRGHSHTLIDSEDAKLVVREADDDRDLFPGFSAHLVGVSVDDEKEFSITLPEDFDNESLAGEEIDIKLTVVAVRSRTLPEMNDLFAQNATEGEVETLLDLRIQTRETLEEASKARAEAELFDDVMQEIIEKAEVKYHDAMVELYLDDIIESMNQTMQERYGMALEDIVKIQQTTLGTIREGQRENAISRLRRDLVVGTLFDIEKISIADDEVEQEMDRVSEQFGEQAEIYRQLLNNPENRRDIANQLLTRALIDRVIAIVTGNAPEIEAEIEAEEDEQSTEDAE